MSSKDYNYKMEPSRTLMKPKMMGDTADLLARLNMGYINESSVPARSAPNEIRNESMNGGAESHE